MRRFEAQTSESAWASLRYSPPYRARPVDNMGILVQNTVLFQTPLVFPRVPLLRVWLRSKGRTGARPLSPKWRRLRHLPSFPSCSVMSPRLFRRRGMTRRGQLWVWRDLKNPLTASRVASARSVCLSIYLSFVAHPFLLLRMPSGLDAYSLDPSSTRFDVRASRRCIIRHEVRQFKLLCRHPTPTWPNHDLGRPYLRDGTPPTPFQVE